MASRSTCPAKPQCQSRKHNPLSTDELMLCSDEKYRCLTCITRNIDTAVEAERLQMEILKAENEKLKVELEELRRENMCQSQLHDHVADPNPKALFEGPGEKWRCASCHKIVVNGENIAFRVGQGIHKN